jgi:ribosome-associated protein
MAEHIRERLKAAGLPGVEVEGLPHCDWVLVDGGDVIVHVFRPEIRAFYNLEKMWGVESPDSETAGVRPEPVPVDSDWTAAEEEEEEE